MQTNVGIATSSTSFWFQPRVARRVGRLRRPPRGNRRRRDTRLLHPWTNSHHLVGEARQYRENVVLAKMSNFKFTRDALAGEQLTYTTTLIDLNDTGARVAAAAHSGTDLVAEGEILFAHANPTQLPPGLPDTKFVFNGELTHLLHMAAAVSKKPSPTV